MRIAIIDHNKHALYIKDINDEILEGQYGGDEQMYIDDNYTLENYSWDYIVDAEYFSEEDSIPMEIDFNSLKDYG